MRRILGACAGALAAALGAVILGEYPFSGVVVVAAAILFGLFVAEAVVVVGGEGGRAPAIVAAVLTAAGLVWAGWISEAHDLGRLRVEGWVAVAVGVATAVVRGWRLGSRAGSPTAHAPPP
ncbi:MAG: hypothetical protein ACR2HV_02360 [Acidimicrobiales bacterium]